MNTPIEWGFLLSEFVISFTNSTCDFAGSQMQVSKHSRHALPIVSLDAHNAPGHRV